MDQYEWLRDDISNSNNSAAAPAALALADGDEDSAAPSAVIESSESSEPQMFAVFKQRAPSTIAAAIDSEAAASEAAPFVAAEESAVETTNEMEETED